MDALLVLGWMRVFFFACFLCPSMAYFMRLFWKERNTLYIQKRHPALIAAIPFFSLIITITTVFFDQESCVFAYCSTASPTMTIVIEFLALCPLLTCTAARIWFLYYDLKYAQGILSHQWWQLLSNENTDWFVANRQKFGRLGKPMVAFLVSVNLLYYMVVFVGAFTEFMIVNLCTSVLTASCWLLMIYCFCRMPQIYDVFGIRKELRLLLPFYFMVAAYFIVSITFELQERVLVLHFANGFVYILQTVVMTALPILSPYYINRSSQINALENVPSRFNVRPNLSAWCEFVNACEDDSNWNAFMSQLMKEFAVENLCFVLEAVQYKQQFIVNHEELFAEKVQINDDETGWMVKLPAGLPRSAILQSTVAEQLVYLYNKYVSDRADLCINVSFVTHTLFVTEMNEIVQYLQSNESSTVEDVAMKEKVLKIFDNALNDVHDNLTNAFFRFRFSNHVHMSKKDIVQAMMQQTGETGAVPVYSTSSL